MEVEHELTQKELNALIPLDEVDSLISLVEKIFGSRKELPEAVQKLPMNGQDIFRAAFNASFKEFGEQRAFAIAWAAVKRRFEKNKEGLWVSKR